MKGPDKLASKAIYTQCGVIKSSKNIKIYIVKHKGFYCSITNVFLGLCLNKREINWWWDRFLCWSVNETRRRKQRA